MSDEPHFTAEDRKQLYDLSIGFATMKVEHDAVIGTVQEIRGDIRKAVWIILGILIVTIVNALLSGKFVDRKDEVQRHVVTSEIK
jgi:hypothetical protein